AAWISRVTSMGSPYRRYRCWPRPRSTTAARRRSISDESTRKLRNRSCSSASASPTLTSEPRSYSCVRLRTACWSLAAMSVARRWAVGSSLSWATTWFTTRSASASVASTKFPVRLISFARRRPTVWGRNTLIPPPGVTPTRAWVSPNVARSDATRKSQPRASSKPPVTAGPVIAPVTRLVIVHSTVKGLRGSSARPPARVAAVGASPPRARVAPTDEVRGRGAELAEVEAGAERGVGAGEDDHVDGVIGFGGRERDRELTLQFGVHGVAGVGTVERHREHTIGRLRQNRFAHGADLSNASSHGHSRARSRRDPSCVRGDARVAPEHRDGRRVRRSSERRATVGRLPDRRVVR